MKYIPRNVRLAYKHTGLTFRGTYFLLEFIRVLQLRGFLTRHLHLRYHIIRKFVT